MRKFFTFIFVIVYILSSNSQQVIQLYNTQDGLVSNGDTILVSGTPQTPEMIAYVKVKNITSGTLEVLSRKYVLSDVQGSHNVFCWAGLCYPPNITESQVQYIAANTIVNDFSGHYYPNGISGIAVIMYTFDPRGGDTAWFYVKYDATGQSIDENKTFRMYKPYPNPASREVYVTYNVGSIKNTFFEVYDIVGEKLFVQPVKYLNGIMMIPVYQLNEGVYFIQLISDGKILGTERVIVKK